jgi:C4-dicarboxylate transporter DctQ subunit
MCFRFLQVMWTFVRTGEVPHHDAAHVEGLGDDDPSFNEAVLKVGAK